MRRSLAVLFPLCVLAVSACDGPTDAGAKVDAAPPPDADTRDVAERLADIPGMIVVERPIDADGYRYFEILYDQPVDHDAPEGARFTQRATLMHRDLGAPMVLHTTGYALYEGPFLDELTYLVRGNQLSVEQRYFADSRPVPTDWSLLTIAQAAADHHRLVSALAPIYGAAWLSTGASKGGMTSIYHRRFYPDDVAGTVAYVAPISFGAPDPRYEPFVAGLGSPECRAALLGYQRALLERRAAMEERVATLIGQGLSLELSGGAAVAFEDSVLGYPWGFWQYGGPGGCAELPGPDASDAELFAHHVEELWDMDDSRTLYFQPYYFQADTQLGYPGMPSEPLADLTVHADDPRAYLPEGVAATYDPSAMRDIDAWVKSAGERLIFVYGELDPWTGGAFELGDAIDSLVAVAPGMNHGAEILDLVPADRDAVLARLEAWTGVTPQASGFAGHRGPPRRTPPPRFRRARVSGVLAHPAVDSATLAR
jgi:hypothetical protein